MINATVSQKFNSILDRLGLSDEEKGFVYLSIAQLVDRRLQDVIEDILTDEDMDRLETMEKEEDAQVYVEEKVQEKLGKSLQDLGDEIMNTVLEEAQVSGIKELLSHIQELM